MDKKRSVETILTITLGFLVIYLIFLWRTGEEHRWMLYVSTSVGILGLAWKWLRYQIHTFWFWLADKLGYVMSRVVLGIIFIFIVIPFASLAKLFRKDLMYLNSGRKSYFRKRAHIFVKEDLENPW